MCVYRVPRAHTRVFSERLTQSANRADPATDLEISQPQNRPLARGQQRREALAY